MKKIYTFILAIGLLISAGNSFAQCGTITSKNLQLNLNGFKSDCDIELCIQYRCSCSTSLPGCIDNSQDYNICTKLDHNTTTIDYMTMPPQLPGQCCTFSILYASIVKTDTAGVPETLYLSSVPELSALQGILDGTSHIDLAWNGVFTTDCNGKPLQHNWIFKITYVNSTHIFIECYPL